VEHDLLVGIFALEKEKLGDDDVGDVVVYFGPQKDNTVLQKTAEDVPVALTPVGRLHHGGGRDEVLHRLERADGLGSILRTLGRHGSRSWVSLGRRGPNHLADGVGGASRNLVPAQGPVSRRPAPSSWTPSSWTRRPPRRLPPL